jgi:hypothetical protein
VACGSACTNLQSDGANCGRCGHKCVAGSCSGGACTSWTVATSSTTSQPVALVSDGTNVIWADTGLNAIMQIPAGGGTTTRLSTDASFSSIPMGSFAPLALGSNVVTWIASTTSAATNVVWKATVSHQDSGAKLPFTFPAGNGLYNLAMNTGATDIGVMNQVNDSSGTPVYHFYHCFPLTSAEACTDVSSFATPLPYLQEGAVANAGTEFFVNMGPSSYQISDFNFTSNSTTTGVFAGNQALAPGFFDSIAIDSTNVYWTTSTQIVKSPLAGGTVTPIVALPTAIGSVMGLASDGTNVYFTTNGNNFGGTSGPSQVLYASIAGCCTSPTSCCTATPLLQGTNPAAIVAPPGSGMIFWIDGSTISGLAAP